MTATLANQTHLPPSLSASPPELLALLAAYPAQAAPLARTWSDLQHAAAWQHVKVLDLASGIPTNTHTHMAALCGTRPDATKREVVVPCLVNDSLTVEHFNALFAAIDGFAATPTDNSAHETERNHLLLSMLSPDGTIVYYKLARGLVKPVN